MYSYITYSSLLYGSDVMYVNGIMYSYLWPHLLMYMYTK